MRSFLFFFLLCVAIPATSQKYYLFIGTYTNTGSKGIYVYRFDAVTGKAQWVSNTEGTVNPSYLAIAPGGRYIYACTETRTVNAGSVSAFSFDRNTGSLTFLNKQQSGGDNPAYVSVHKSGKWVAIANYSGGSLSVFPVNKDGSLQPFRRNIQDTGKSVVEQRQDKAHVHSVVFSPGQNYLFAPDLGIDKVMIYRFNPEAKDPLQPANPAYAASIPGSGPRHLTFHPNGKFAYLVEELGGTVVAYKYNPANGELDSLQRISAHPDTTSPPFGSADIHISPDGKFLYASNRANENNIAIFSINQATGKLKPKGYQSTKGKTPRNFIIDPSGTFLLAANQDSDNIVIFRRDSKTGLLEPSGDQISIPQPVCLQMMKVER